MSEVDTVYFKSSSNIKIPGGGTQMLFGRGCAAEASKPVPIFKGHFGGKGYPLLGIFSQENDVFVYFCDKMGENI